MQKQEDHEHAKNKEGEIDSVIAEDVVFKDQIIGQGKNVRQRPVRQVNGFSVQFFGKWFVEKQGFHPSLKINDAFAAEYPVVIHQEFAVHGVGICDDGNKGQQGEG